MAQRETCRRATVNGAELKPVAGGGGRRGLRLEQKSLHSKRRMRMTQLITRLNQTILNERRVVADL